MAVALAAHTAAGHRLAVAAAGRLRMVVVVSAAMVSMVELRKAAKPDPTTAPVVAAQARGLLQEQLLAEMAPAVC